METNTPSPGSLEGSTSRSTHHLHVRDCSPAPWPPQVGELVILYTSPESKLRGFVGWVERIEVTSGRYMVRLLDSHTNNPTMTFFPEELISTGKTGDELVKQYLMDDLSLSQAIETERSMPDFDLVKPKTKAKSSTKAKPKSLNQALKSLTPEQVESLARLVLTKLKETKK